MSEHDWLDSELGAVAREDAQVEVPRHIEAAVMRAWDSGGVEAGTSRGRYRGRRTWVVAAGLAAAVLALILVRMDPEAPMEGSGAPDAHTALQTPQAPPDPLEPYLEPQAPQAPDAPQARREPQAPLELQTPQAPSEPPEPQSPRGREYVLVPDPFGEVTPMHLVRARMSQAAFATLGLPIGAPDAEGLVEVEMLVGDDGVARTIRRATFVAAGDGGVQR